MTIIPSQIRTVVKKSECETTRAVLELFAEDPWFLWCPEFREEVAAMLGEMGLAEVVVSEVLN